LTSRCNCEDESSSSDLFAMLQTIDLSSLRTAHHIRARTRDVAVTPEVSALLAANAAVAIGVSGGKDNRSALASENRRTHLVAPYI
jgi:hypothetical protein